MAAVREVSGAPAADPDTLRAQARVLTRLAKGSASILPARFGAVFPDRAALEAQVERARPKLLEALAHVRDCVQMNLRVFDDTQPAGPGTSPPVQPERSAQRGVEAGPGTRYLADRLAARVLPDAAKRLLASAQDLTKDERIEPSGPPPLRWTVYHLVPKAELRRYRAALAKAERSKELPSLRWLLTGPFPPHAFAPEGLG